MEMKSGLPMTAELRVIVPTQFYCVFAFCFIFNFAENTQHTVIMSEEWQMLSWIPRQLHHS